MQYTISGLVEAERKYLKLFPDIFTASYSICTINFYKANLDSYDFLLVVFSATATLLEPRSKLNYLHTFFFPNFPHILERLCNLLQKKKSHTDM